MQTTGHSPRGAWSLAGLLGGLAGLAASHLAAALLHVRESPVVVVAETIVRIIPGPLVEWGIDAFGVFDKPFLVLTIIVALAAVFALAGQLGRRGWWLTAIPYGVLAAIGAIAVLVRPGTSPSVDLMPVLVGLLTWLVVTSLLSAPLRDQEQDALEADRAPERTAVPAGVRETGDSQHVAPVGLAPNEHIRLTEQTRRSFLTRAGVVAGVAVLAAVGGEVLGRGRRGIERARALLALPVSRPMVPGAARIGVDGVSSWVTPNEEFYVIHTAFAVPTIDPDQWQLRIHGMVEREVTISFADLVSGELTEAWTTLNCVSNEVGGDLIGNAWWSGVPARDLLALAGPLDGADAVLQTSEDGWNCGTPLATLVDPDREAMLAVAMNGVPLPVEHGFPVRTVVPGLYGYVSACKWVVDWEVTRFEDVSAYWTENGWSEQGPVKVASRIDVPASGDDVAPGEVVVAGVAWFQHTGIQGVQVSLDGGAWTDGEIADAGLVDSWVQWRVTFDGVEPGDHDARVRAVPVDGEPQTGAVADTVPDGATGWHEVGFSVRDA